MHRQASSCSDRSMIPNGPLSNPGSPALLETEFTWKCFPYNLSRKMIGFPINGLCMLNVQNLVGLSSTWSIKVTYICLKFSWNHWCVVWCVAVPSIDITYSSLYWLYSDWLHHHHSTAILADWPMTININWGEIPCLETSIKMMSNKMQSSVPVHYQLDCDLWVMI